MLIALPVRERKIKSDRFDEDIYIESEADLFNKWFSLLGKGIAINPTINGMTYSKALRISNVDILKEIVIELIEERLKKRHGQKDNQIRN